MEYWGVQVKARQIIRVKPGAGQIIHISHAAIGEVEKGEGSAVIPLYLGCNGMKIVVGSFSSENFPQAIFKLAFEKDFELSHGAEKGSIYIFGYSTAIPSVDDKEDTVADGKGPSFRKVKAKQVKAKPAASKGEFVKPESSSKPQVTFPEAGSFESDDSDASEDSEEGLADGNDEDMLDGLSVCKEDELITCNTCSKTFISEAFLQSHCEYKHAMKMVE